MAYTYGAFQPNYGNGMGYQTVYPTQAPNPYSGYQTAVPMQQMPQMPQMQPQVSQQNNNTGFVWVQGEAGAKAYAVSAGNSVLLMDSENPVLYMKSTDASGRPLPIETYDLVRREEVQTRPMIPKSQAAPIQEYQVPDLSEYVKMSDLEEKVRELVNKALEG